MNSRKVIVIASALFVSMVAGAASAQAPSGGTARTDQARTENLVKESVQRYREGIRAAAEQAIALQAQAAPTAAPGSVPMTLEEAVRHAVDNNLEMAVERLNPRTFDLTLAGLRATYNPTATSRYGRNDNLNAPTNLLNQGVFNNSIMTYNVGLTKNMEWGGGSLITSFNNAQRVSADPNSNFNPQFSNSYTMNFTQPLLRGFKIDPTRQQIRTQQINLNNAELNVSARTTNTLAAVRSAYWDYVFSIQAVDVARESLTLAQKLLSDNKIRVEVGTMAPMDVVQAEAEEATRQQTLTTATATMRTAELALKRLIVGGTSDPLWMQHIDPIDRPDFQEVSIDVEGAVRDALTQRTDLRIARNQMDTNNVLLKSFNDQRLPEVDANVIFGATGIGGTQYEFAGTGFDRVKTGEIPGGYTDAFRTLMGRDYPNWTAQILVSYPIGGSQASAQAARQRVLLQQNQAQIRATELQVATEVTNAALQVTNGTEGLAASRAARELSQRRLDAEMSRFDVGMSTNYQVVQAQRDLRDAQNSELRALLNYRKSLVEFDRVQQAGAR